MQKLIIFTGILLFSGWVAANPPKLDAETSGSADLISAELIQEAGWNRNWQMALPLKADEAIVRLAVMGPHLYILTDSNILLCMDRKKGRILYTTRLSAANLPVSRPLLYEDKLWFMVGREMMAFDPAIGSFSEQKQFAQIGSSAACGVARNKDFLYISGSDNRLHAIHTDGYWQKFTATADNDSPIISVLATDSIVVFATQAGNVVGMSPDKAEKLWQFDVTGRIKSELVLDGNDVYVGSFDSKLYKLGLLDGKLSWTSPFHSGAPIRDSFFVGTETIYLYNAINGLYGVNKQTGKPIWQVDSGEGVICETSDKGFVFASPGIVKVMDNKTGNELYSVNVSSVRQYAENTTDDVMYLTDGKGRLMSVTVR